MIRDRRDEDLPRLCAVLRTLGHPTAPLTDAELTAWLTGGDAVLSWVFDMAPVAVTPTRNVAGHVQVTGAAGHPATPAWVEHTGRPAGELLVVAKLFVRPERHEHGIARYLLTEAVAHVRSRGRTPVLDLRANRLPSVQLAERLGFAAVPAADPETAPMVHQG